MKNWGGLIYTVFGGLNSVDLMFFMILILCLKRLRESFHNMHDNMGFVLERTAAYWLSINTPVNMFAYTRNEQGVRHFINMAAPFYKAQ